MLSAKRLSGGVVSRRSAFSRLVMLSRSRSRICSGYRGFVPWRKSSQPPPPARVRSRGRCDQYHTSSAPTFHGVSRHPYHPSAPYMVGYCLRPPASRACAFTASIMRRQASTYFWSPVTSSALLKPTSARGIRFRSSRLPVTGFTGLNPQPYAFFHHLPSAPPILPSSPT